jgi:regulator of ribosome biosynthesis
MIDYEVSPNDIRLPETQTIFPRSRPLPSVKELTKWEKFAKDKGIKQKKRSRMVYSEITKSWVPRWGADSVKKVEDKANPIIELRKNDPNNADPFMRKGAEKRIVKDKQLVRQMKNEERTGMKEMELKRQQNTRLK